jgi:hypothetical protein
MSKKNKVVPRTSTIQIAIIVPNTVINAPYRNKMMMITLYDVFVLTRLICTDASYMNFSFSRHDYFMTGQILIHLGHIYTKVAIGTLKCMRKHRCSKQTMLATVPWEQTELVNQC